MEIRHGTTIPSSVCWRRLNLFDKVYLLLYLVFFKNLSVFLKLEIFIETLPYISKVYIMEFKRFFYFPCDEEISYFYCWLIETKRKKTWYGKPFCPVTCLLSIYCWFSGKHPNFEGLFRHFYGSAKVSEGTKEFAIYVPFSDWLPFT